MGERWRGSAKAGKVITNMILLFWLIWCYDSFLLLKYHAKIPPIYWCVGVQTYVCTCVCHNLLFLIISNLQFEVQCLPRIISKLIFYSIVYFSGYIKEYKTIPKEYLIIDSNGIQYYSKFYSWNKNMNLSFTVIFPAFKN